MTKVLWINSVRCEDFVEERKKKVLETVVKMIREMFGEDAEIMTIRRDTLLGEHTGGAEGVGEVEYIGAWMPDGMPPKDLTAVVGVATTGTLRQSFLRTIRGKMAEAGKPVLILWV